MSTAYRVFVSYDPVEDGLWKRQLLTWYGGRCQFRDHAVDLAHLPGLDLPPEAVDGLVHDGVIRDAAVTLVLVGRDTWRCAHVDQEIRASQQATRRHGCTGLLAILTPSYELTWSAPHAERQPTMPYRAQFWPRTLPQELWQRVAQGDATVRPWPESAWELEAWVAEAARSRDGPAPVGAWMG